MALNGWIVLDKPVGLGSTQAVAAVKRMLRNCGHLKPKVGHGGTLDPLASGVLPIALGEATKLVGRILDGTKDYDFAISFGEETDTLDLEGQVIRTSDVRPTLLEIEAVLPEFTGSISQIPPAYSALKVDGRRAYDLARSGKEVELQARSVTVHELRIATSAPDQVTLSARVSKGTYIRSLARDIARALGTVGHVGMLRRTRADPFTLSQAITLDFLNLKASSGKIGQAILPIDAGLGDIPHLAIDEEEARLLRHGLTLRGHSDASGLYLASLSGMPVALVEFDGGDARVVRGFNCE
jgi:tRNA pseudouridine55 synthase